MLDIGFSELLLTAIVALVVVGPKDMPVVLRQVMRVLRELRGMAHGIRQQITEAIDVVGVEEMKTSLTTIIDLEGKPQPAYDVRDLATLRSPTLPVEPPPQDNTEITP